MKRTISAFFQKKIFLFLCLSFSLVLIAAVLGDYYYYRTKNKDVLQKRAQAFQINSLSLLEIINKEMYQNPYGGEEKLKKDLKEKVEAAHTVIQSLYKKYGKESLSYIVSALRDVRFFEGRGYYFISDFQGKELLYPIEPQLEGKNLFDLKDEAGNYVVREEIALCRGQGEGFTYAFWMKPGKNRAMAYAKLSYVKAFLPLGIYVGTGEYVDCYTKNGVTSLLKTLTLQPFAKSLLVVDEGDVSIYRGMKINLDKADLAKLITLVDDMKDKTVYRHTLNRNTYFIHRSAYWNCVFVLQGENEFPQELRELKKLIWVKALIVAAFLFLLGIIFYHIFPIDFFKREIDNFIHRLLTSMQTLQVNSNEHYFFWETTHAAEVFNNFIIEHKEGMEVYRSMLDNTVDGIIILQNLQVVYANQAVVRITGYPCEELFNLTKTDIQNLIHPDDRALILQRYHCRLAGENEPNNYEYRVIAKTGAIVWLEQTVHVISYRGETALQIAILDITEKVLARQEAKQLQSNYKHLLENAFEAIVVVQKEIIVFSNKKLESFVESAGVLGQNFCGIFYPEDIADLDFFSSTVTKELRLRLNTADKQLFWVGIKSTEIPWQKESAFLFFIRDINREVKKETEILLAKEKAEQANTAKIKFLSNISHEIRTPMNGILGFTELLLHTTLTEQQEEYLQLIKNSSHQLIQLLGDILDITNIEAGEVQIERQVFSLQRLVKTVIGTNKKDAERKNLILDYTIDTSLPDKLKGDACRLRQVLHNLLDNAIKFTDEGQVFLTVTKRNDFPVKVEFKVKDTGIGIDKKNREKIFSNFTKADHSVSRLFGGMGLGLAIAANLTKLMGGELKVNSKVGEGAEFFFALTLTPAEAGETLGNLTVLLAEDNIINKKIIESFIRYNGWDFLWAENGKVALEIMQEHHPDIILMDVQMPIMGGIEAATKIKQNPAWSDIPIIALTAYLEEEQSCFEAVMTKPVDFAKIKKAIGELCQAPQSQA